MAESQKFAVEVSGNTITAWDWVEAARVPREELQRRGLAGRHELAQALADERVLDRAVEFGDAVEALLARLGEKYRLLGVIAEPGKKRWLLRIQTEQGVGSVAVPEDWADDVMDSGALQDLARLKNHLQEWLSRGDLIALSR
jgi:hypothetical protein